MRWNLESIHLFTSVCSNSSTLFLPRFSLPPLSLLFICFAFSSTTSFHRTPFSHRSFLFPTAHSFFNYQCTCSSNLSRFCLSLESFYNQAYLQNILSVNKFICEGVPCFTRLKIWVHAFAECYIISIFSNITWFFLVTEFQCCVV